MKITKETHTMRIISKKLIYIQELAVWKIGYSTWNMRQIILKTILNGENKKKLIYILFSLFINFCKLILSTLAKGEETRNENSSITKSLIMIDEMDITKLSTIEINLIKKLSNKIDCLEKNKPKLHPVQIGKYKYPVSELNNMKLTYEKILTEAALCSKRFDKRYSVHELTDESQIGVFARQTLSEEIRK